MPAKKTKKNSFDFADFTKIISEAAGTLSSLILAFLFIVIWIISGPFFHFSDTWQLIINTSTTIITFLMVFIIQHTQNRDIKILNLKLDELIKSSSAKNTSIDLEKLTDDQLKKLEAEYEKLCNKKDD